MQYYNLYNTAGNNRHANNSAHFQETNDLHEDKHMHYILNTKCSEG